MTLLAPLMLLGLLGLSLPIIAHLLGREPPRTIRFAAMRFLPQTERSVTHRRRVRDIPLLLVRLLLLALLVLALARPATLDRTGVAMVAEPHDAIIVLDGSRSMDLRVDEQRLIEHAGVRARALLQSLPPGSRVGLVTSDPNGPRVEPSEDRDRVWATIEAWLGDDAPRPGAWLLRDALPVASALLQGATTGTVDPDRKQAIYAISDGTERGLGSLPATVESNVALIPVPAIDPQTVRPEHVAVTHVDWAPAPELDPRAVRVEAVVHRFPGSLPRSPGDAEPRTVALGLFIGDTEVARTTVDLPMDEDIAVEFTHTLLDGAETAAATVMLLDEDDDPHPSDDRRHLWLSADEALEVLVINGDPSELRAHDEVFFLTTAVAAMDESRNIRMRSVAPDQLEEALRTRKKAALADVDVLVLANVRAPEQDVAPLIVDRVRAGMGLFISVGDRVEPDAYNARFGAVLPLLMREVVHVGTAPGRTEARAEGIAPADLSHPSFRGLSGDLGLSGARARRIVLLEPNADRPADIALAFTSGAPALLTRGVDQGRVGLLTTTIDRDWADLPMRPGFVPLIHGVLSYLGGSRAGVTGTRVAVGEPRSLRSQGPVIVRTPSGREVSIAPDAEGLATFRETWTPGHHRARGGDDESLFSVEVDPAESDTRWVELDEPSDETASQRVAVTVPRWRWLLPLVAGLLALETVLRWRRRRAPKPS
jgi:hypothetical protein